MENIKMDDTLIGQVLQSYAQQGCEFCNPNHPEYEDIFGIKTKRNGVHYINIIINFDKERDEYDTFDLEVYYCHKCGKKL